MKKRIIHYTLILIFLIVINFLLPRLLPGSPIKSIIGDSPGDMTAMEKMSILQAYHLDQPIHIQFAHYIKELFTMDWGDSFAKRQPIAGLIWSRLGWTALLAGLSTILSTIIGTMLGCFSSFHRRKNHDIPIVLTTTVISSIPSFWIAIILIAIFSVKLGLLPIYGAYSMWENYTGMARVLDILKHLALPLFTLTITSLMLFFTVSRYSTFKAMHEDYVQMARLRGISNRTVFFGHILRNSIIPVFTMFMMDIGYLLSGSVIIETVFSYPGLGSLIQEAVMARDYPLMQYTFLISAIMTVVALFLADTLYHRIDPRLEMHSND